MLRTIPRRPSCIMSSLLVHEVGFVPHSSYHHGLNAGIRMQSNHCSEGIQAWGVAPGYSLPVHRLLVMCLFER